MIHLKGYFCLKLVRLNPMVRSKMEWLEVKTSNLATGSALCQGCNKTFSFVVSPSSFLGVRFLSETE